MFSSKIRIVHLQLRVQTRLELTLFGYSILLHYLNKCEGMAQWWERSPPTNVARGSNLGVDAICGLRLLLVLYLAPRGFSRGTPVPPPPSSKTNISKFQFDQESGRRRTTLWMCYLHIFIIVVNHYYYSYGNQYFLAWFSLRKGKRFVSKKEIYLSLTFTQWLGFLAHNCKMVCWKRMKAFLCFVFIYIYL